MATKFRFNYNNQTVDFDDYYVRSDIFTQGNLWSWGFNGSGGLGDNTVIHRSSPVQVISGGANWKSVSIGYQQTAAIKTDGTLWMFGDNTYGCLGNNSNTSTSSPVQTITGGNNWIQIWAGVRFNTAIKTDGSLWCWGRNANGQLGDNTVIDKSSPIQVLTFSQDWLQSSCGYRHAACIKTDGTLWCWGHNSYGQLGDNTVTHRSSPVQTIAGGTNWKSLACGYNHTAAIKSDGTLWLWGQNTNGKLGDNSTTFRSSPVQTVTYGTWKQVECGQNHTAAIKNDGTLWCWGNNSDGNLGDNTRTHRSSPVQTITFGNTWKVVACAFYGCSAIKTDGTLWTWGGFGGWGDGGDNTNVTKSSPVQTAAFGNNWKSCKGGRTYRAALTYNDTLVFPQPTFNPKSLSNLTLYLDAGDINSYPGTGTTWTDLSGNNYNFTVNASAWNAGGSGLPPHFNFEGSFGHATRTTSTDVPNATNGTFVVFTSILNSTGNWRTLTRGATNDHQVIIQSGGNLLGMYDNDSAGFISSGFDITSLPNPYTQFNCLIWKLSQNSPYYQFAYNGTNFANTITNASATFNNGFYTIGGVSSVQYWGKIAVFLYYSRHLEDWELQYLIQGYRKRMGI